MAQIMNDTGYTIITAILPKESATSILDKALSVKISTNIIIHARGTLYRDKWYQKFRPSIVPENTIFELLVPQRFAQAVMDGISTAAGLHEGKRGAVFCMGCSNAVFMDPGV